MKRLFVFLVLLSGCISPRAERTRPQVLVTLPPYEYFVGRLAGDTVEVVSLIPEGANPHLYDIRPQEMKRVQNAQLWLRLGDEFDARVKKFFESTHPDLQIVDVSKDIALLKEWDAHGHGGEDLHIWLSPRLAQTQARTIADALRDLLPGHHKEIQNNLDNLLADLAELDQHCQIRLAPKRGNAILVSHPAFAYFCQDYGLVQLSVEQEGKEIRPQELQTLIRRARDLGVTSVLLEPQYSDRGAREVARQLGVPTYVVDPYSSDYLRNLHAIAQRIAS